MAFSINTNSKTLAVIRQGSCFLILFLSLQFAQAQDGISVGIGSGAIIPINTVFPEVKGPSIYSELSWVRQTKAKNQLWAKNYNYPVLMLSASYQSLGNREVLGYTLGFIPSLGFYLKRKEHFTIQANIGLGVAYANKPYNKIKNPENNVIGSSVSAYARAKLWFEWIAKPELRFLGGFGLTHYSNGNLVAPNLGSNTPLLLLACQYYPNWQEPNSFDTDFVRKDYSRKVHFNLRSSLGFTETGFDGPKYPVYTGSLGLSRQFSYINRLNTGFEYIFNRAPYEFMLHVGYKPGEEFKESSRYLWFVGHEFLFGHIGFTTELGVYLNKHFQQGSPFSSKIGFNFYPINTLKVHRFQAYAGIYVRAYMGEAEFVEFATGFSF